MRKSAETKPMRSARSGLRSLSWAGMDARSGSACRSFQRTGFLADQRGIGVQWVVKAQEQIAVDLRTPGGQVHGLPMRRDRFVLPTDSPSTHWRDCCARGHNRA